MTRVAMFMHGGIAAPGSMEEVPALAGLVRRLAGQFAVTVYTVVKADGRKESFRFGEAEVKFVRARDGGHPVEAAYQFLRAFGKDHRNAPFALVHGFWGLPGGIAAVLAGRRHGVASIVSILGGEAASLPEIRYGNMGRMGSRGVTLWTCRQADALCVLTRYQLKEFSRNGFRRSRGVHVIPFGAEAELFPFRDRGPSTPPFHFLHVGHVSPVKDQATLLRAFQVICRQVDAELRIVGEDTLRGTLQRLALELGIAGRVKLTGFIPHRGMGEQYAWADMLLHTSLYEGEGVALAEAAASGLPVCGTRVGLLADLEEGLGVSVGPGDHDGLARAVLALLCDRGQREVLVARARRWADAHDAEWSARQYAGLYEELTATEKQQRIEDGRWKIEDC